jgi:hypothetical protein
VTPNNFEKSIKLQLPILLKIYVFSVQFIVTPNNFEKSIKLQLPILLATYPLRNDDGTIRR